MRKRLMKIRHWGVRVSIVSLFFFLSLAIVSIATATTHAAPVAPFAVTPTVAPPTVAPSPVPTQPAPTPTAQPQPTTPPATQPPVAPTPVGGGAGAPPPQQNPGQGQGAAPGTGPNQPSAPQPTPTFAVSGTPGDMSVGSPGSAQQQDMNSPLDPIFGPLGVSVMLISIMGVAAIVLVLMRRKQPVPSVQGAQAFSQTGRPATTPVPAASQREIALSSAQSGRISLDPHGAVTEMYDAVSSQHAPNSDFSPLPRTELPRPVENKANISQPQRAAAMPPAPPETPSLHNGESSGNSEIVNTGQLMAMMRQAQAGLFVIPEREQEKQTR